MAEGDPAAIQVVWRYFHRYPVPEQYTDVIFPHFSAQVSEDLVIVIELDDKLGAGEGFDHGAIRFNFIFGFWHRRSSNPVFVFGYTLCGGDGEWLFSFRFA
jgi:hypothetical protein